MTTMMTTTSSTRTDVKAPSRAVRTNASIRRALAMNASTSPPPGSTTSSAGDSSTAASSSADTREASDVGPGNQTPRSDGSGCRCDRPSSGCSRRTHSTCSGASPTTRWAVASRCAGRLTAPVRRNRELDVIERGARPPTDRQAVDGECAGGLDGEIGTAGRQCDAGHHRPCGVTGAEEQDVDRQRAGDQISLRTATAGTRPCSPAPTGSA